MQTLQQTQVKTFSHSLSHSCYRYCYVYIEIKIHLHECEMDCLVDLSGGFVEQELTIPDFFWVKQERVF